MQSENADSPMLVMLLGNVICLILLQPKNAEWSTSVPPSIVTSFKLVGTYS